ncbi:hypothetical protein GCM10020229_24850 [Kitasatospora albolonga]
MRSPATLELRLCQLGAVRLLAGAAERSDVHESAPVVHGACIAGVCGISGGARRQAPSGGARPELGLINRWRRRASYLPEGSHLVCSAPDVWVAVMEEIARLEPAPARSEASVLGRARWPGGPRSGGAARRPRRRRRAWSGEA